MTLAFIDTETTGLDLERHRIWELALIIEGHDDPDCDGEYLWQFPVDLATADPTALRVCGFHKRYVRPPHVMVCNMAEDSSDFETYANVAIRIMRLLDGAHLVGSVPDFDAYRLRMFLREHDGIESWHYHLVDVENLAVGYLGGRGTPMSPPWNSDGLSRAIGVEPPGEGERHTALGDARWAKRMYEKVMSFCLDATTYYATPEGENG